MTFLKNHWLQIISFIAIVVIIIGFASFAATPKGQEVIDKLLEQFPFSSFVYENYKKITGNEVEAEKIHQQSLASNLIKLEVTTCLSCLLMTLLAKLFLNVRVPKNQILTQVAHDIVEETTNSFSYILKFSLLTTIVTTVSVFLGNKGIDWLNDFFDQKNITTARPICYLIVFLFFFFLLSLIRAYLYNLSVRTSLNHTMFFVVLPETFSTLVTTSLILLAHYTYKDYGFGWQMVACCVALVAWCIISELLMNRLRAWSIGYERDTAGEVIRFSNLFAGIYFYLFYFIIYYFSYESVQIAGFYQQKYVKLFFNLPELPFFTILSGGFSPSDFHGILSIILSEFWKLMLFGVLVSFSQSLCRNSSYLMWSLKQGIFSLLIIAEYSVVLYGYSHMDSIWLVLSIIAILMLAFIGNLSIWKRAVEILLVFVACVIAYGISNYFYGTPIEKSLVLFFIFAAAYFIFILFGMHDARKRA